MKALVLWAEQHSANLGVRALGQGSAALLERVWPGIEVEFQGFGPGAAPIRIGNPRTLARHFLARRSELVDWIRTFDLVVDTRAGDSFADIYGLRRLATMSAMAELVRKAGVPMVMGPQTIGPFGTRRGTNMARWSLRRATVVMARDSDSARESSRLGRRVDALTTDVVFALDVPQVPKTREVIFNVSGLLWSENPHVDSARYQQVVTEICRSVVAGGRRLTLLSHVLDSDLADNDVPAAKDLAGRLDGVAEVVVPRSLAEVREVLASGAVVAGSRMHACLNALSVGTPAVSLAYSRKFEPLMRDLGWTQGVDLRTDENAGRTVLDMLDRDDLDDQVQAVRRRADALLATAEQALRAVPLRAAL